MEAQVNRHYSSENLGERIRHALTLAGKDPDSLELKDLSVIDQLHTGGHVATLELIRKTGLSAGMTVLDVGCGIGGTSRLLAETLGCRVLGLDLVPAFVQVAEALTIATRLSGLVRYIQGSALSMPVEDASVDCVWSQHTLMNIEDKPAVFREFARVLRPGGLLVLHEIARGENAPLDLPVPWADRQEISFLEPWERTRHAILEAGFTPVFENDRTDQAREWWTRVKAAAGKAAAAPRPLGPHLVFGDNGRLFGTTMTSNLDRDCIRLTEAVFTRA
jgi:ubiquinone/menaquinone biosynthesis C-methylase UbiE